MRRLFTCTFAFALPLLALPLAARADPATERLWKAKCGSCHGPDGKAQTEQGKKMAIEDMSTAAWQAQFSDDKLAAAINDGLKRDKNGTHQEMDAYKSKLRPDQVTALVAYVRALKK
jgi:mono/diheme cytochrome c family protein